ncbi:hypothetical protein [Shewanella atlantica]|uniref:Uncharacterized protein n=1 Tax=Shewanella atlantica TaxID=271099 RepID=A0A431WDE0_9GAMM|nr:hypothetical protein [Shewanella atlantica]RTR33533.1 hypothetical protein EKG39_07360 [Shewanella atlantica]
MLSRTRFWFLTNFGTKNGSIDSQKAADYIGVSPRTVRQWWRVGCPPWIDKLAELASRTIPETKDWDGFTFKDGRLITPYDKLTFAPSELMRIFYDRQFNRFDRVEKDQLKTQVNELRNEDEAHAIREEIDGLILSLESLKRSPIVAPKLTYAKTVRNKRK